MHSARQSSTALWWASYGSYVVNLMCPFTTMRCNCLVTVNMPPRYLISLERKSLAMGLTLYDMIIAQCGFWLALDLYVWAMACYNFGRSALSSITMQSSPYVIISLFVIPAICMAYCIAACTTIVLFQVVSYATPEKTVCLVVKLNNRGP